MKNHIDHIVIGSGNLQDGTKILENKLNTKFSIGGEHHIMGTHNNLLKLQSNTYLEIIANNPNVENPSRQRWFSLDEEITRKKILHFPRILSWVLEVENIENTKKNCGYDPGEILQISRGELIWKMTVPSNGMLTDNGILPSLIEWTNGQHPSKKLTTNNISIKRISLFHPEPNRIKNIISNLIESDLIRVSAGVPKIELILTVDNKEIMID